MGILFTGFSHDPKNTTSEELHPKVEIRFPGYVTLHPYNYLVTMVVCMLNYFLSVFGLHLIVSRPVEGMRQVVSDRTIPHVLVHSSWT